MPEHLGRQAMAGLDLDRGWGWDWARAWDWELVLDWDWDFEQEKDLVEGKPYNPHWVRLPQEARDA